MLFIYFSKLTRVLLKTQAAIVNRGQTGRVIAPIFELGEGIE